MSYTLILFTVYFGLEQTKLLLLWCLSWFPSHLRSSPVQNLPNLQTGCWCPPSWSSRCGRGPRPGLRAPRWLWTRSGPPQRTSGSWAPEPHLFTRAETGARQEVLVIMRRGEATSCEDYLLKLWVWDWLRCAVQHVCVRKFVLPSLRGPDVRSWLWGHFWNVRTYYLAEC